MNFIDAVEMDVAAVAPIAAPAGLAVPALALPAAPTVAPVAAPAGLAGRGKRLRSSGGMCRRATAASAV